MSYKLLSFDIGIKNLSYCILSYDTEIQNEIKYKIEDWGIINILEDELEEMKCEGYIKKTGLQCKKNCNNYILTEDNKKACYCGIHIKEFKKNNIKIYQKKKINLMKIEIQLLFKYLIKSLENYKEKFNDINDIFLENQPALINPRMKTVQMGVYTYFYVRELIDKTNPTVEKINLISASNKLKVYNGPKIISNAKNKYNKNKELAIEHCKYFIKHDSKNLEFFLNHKKKDDLADAFLQGLYCINQKYNVKKKKK